MITEIKIGDIFKSEAQTIINTVNCVGVMGKGLALEYKKKYPEMFDDYKQKCSKKIVKPGVPYLYKPMFPPWILNFPTKNHWRSGSLIENIKKGLEIIQKNYKIWGITSIAVPPLGCGNGQLEWSVVGPLIYKKLKKLDIPVEIYCPYGTSPEFLSKKNMENPVNNDLTIINEEITPEILTLVEIVYQIYKNKYHYPVGRTIFQKIAYVATEQGLETNLTFTKQDYGPYSKELKKIITKLANSNLILEEQKNSLIELKPTSEYKKIREENINQFKQCKKIIDKTTDLFLRLNTEKAEIVATIFYSTRKLKKEKEKVSETDVLNYVLEWKKNRLKPIEIGEAIRNLGMLRWLNVDYCKDLPVIDWY